MKDKEELLELYKLHAKFAHDITSFRQQINTVYFSVLSIVAAVVVAWIPTGVALCVLAMFLCLIWFFTIAYYRRLNQGKFKMLDKIEDGLIMKPFAMEWEYVKKGCVIGGLSLTHLEMLSPLVFFVFFLLLLCK